MHNFKIVCHKFRHSFREPDSQIILLDKLQTRWADYFLEDIDADDVADDLRDAGLKDRLIGPDEHFLVSPVTLCKTTVAKQATCLDQLGQIMINVLRDRFEQDSSRLLRQLGYPDAAEDVLAGTGLPIASPFGRWDILATSQGWRVLEFNVGGATAGQDDRLMQQVYDRVAPDGPSVFRHPVPFETLARYLPADIGPGVVVCDDDDELAQSPISALIAAQSLRHLTGQDVPIVPASALLSGSQRPSAVFELFTVRECLRNPDRYAPYLSALSTGAFLSINPVQTDLLMNKATMALVWQAREGGMLSPEDAAIVDDLLPWTVLVSPETRGALEQRTRQQTVLKTANGFGGQDVHCGWTMDDAAWAELLDAAVSGDTVYVAQQRVVGVQASLVAMSPQGEFIAFDAPPVLGIFCDGDQYGGGFARASLTDHAVVNAHNGAAVGVIRTVEA